MSSDEEGDDEGEAEDELKGGPEHGHEADEVEGAADVLLVGGLEGGDLGFFLGKGADEAGTGEILLGLGRDVGEHGLNPLEARVDARAKVLDEDGGDGKGHEGVEGQLRAYVQHEREGGRGEDEGVGRVHDGRAEELADGGEVIGGAGHDVAGAVGVEEAGRLALKVGEDVVAEVEFYLAGGSDDDLAGDVKEDRGAAGHGEDAEGVVDDLGLGDAEAEVIDRVADDQREEDGNDVVEDDGHAAPGELFPISPEVGGKGFEAFEHGCGVNLDRRVLSETSIRFG